jgi:SpoVK/Ycf46/Vps4 family AAA+-type ATPase
MGAVYSELYPKINLHKLINAYAESKETLLILCGEPGVGKTSFIKALIQDGRFNDIGYAKDSKLLSNDNFWQLIVENEHDLLILDDLDSELKNRNQFMNQLLSFSDGIFSGNNTKIIITTNQEIKAIDPAVVRPGRCFDFIKLEALSYEEAKTFWIDKLKLPIENFNKVFSPGYKIDQARLMSEASQLSAQYKRDYITSGPSMYNITEKIESLGIKVSDKESILFK